MFRVPASADAPSFDQTFKVGFWRWLTSSKADRLEWQARRVIATRLQHDQNMARIREQYGEASEQLRAEMARIRREIVAQIAARSRR